MKRRILMVAVLPVFLAGCFGSTPEETTAPPLDPGTPDTAPSTIETPAEPSNVYVDVTDSQGEGDYVGAITDVVASSCASDGASWIGSGSVLNPTDEDVDYRVWISFLDSEGETVGLVQSNVDGVEPDDLGEYSASMPYADAGPLSCVLRVEGRVPD